MADRKRRVPTKPHPIRFSSGAEALISRMAAESGIGFAQFVREAALVRAAILYAQSHPLEADDLQSVYVAAREALETGRFDP